MIPANNGFLQKDFEIETIPSRTYRMDLARLRMLGECDGKEALMQSIYKILNTERYEYAIYSWNYGVEFYDLFGEPMSFVIPEIKRRIEEALLVDDRIIACRDFTFEETGKSSVLVTFTIDSTFGTIGIEKEVAI